MREPYEMTQPECPRGAVSRPAVVAAGAALAVMLLVGLAGCGGKEQPDGGRSGGSDVTTGASVTVDAPDTTVPPTTIDPGTLPQTEDKPSATGEELGARAELLWQAIVEDDPEIAMPAFFPLSAYKQVKDITNPESDWNNRLIGAYEADVHALHKQLGASGDEAVFEGIDVPVAAAQWIKPGGEYNKIGYWRVYGTTLRYSVDGREATLPVYSLISWRGEWYVVHLGPIR